MGITRIGSGTGRILVTLILLAAGGFQQTVRAEVTLSQPDCPTLTDWASGLEPSATFSPAEGITVNRKFDDAAVIPLFGVTLLQWQNDDTTALQRWLTDCRREAAGAKDAAARGDGDNRASLASMVVALGSSGVPADRVSRC